jgi:hypothetical protein
MVSSSPCETLGNLPTGQSILIRLDQFDASLNCIDDDDEPQTGSEIMLV